MPDSKDSIDAELEGLDAQPEPTPPPVPEITPDFRAELEAIDAELQQTCPPAPPEVFYQLGQMVGEERADRPGTSLLQAVGKIVWRPLDGRELEAFKGTYPHVKSQPYSGPAVPALSDEEVAQIRAEQLAGIVTPTHRAPMTHVGVIEELEEVCWFPLEALEAFPLRGQLRNSRGRRLSAEIVKEAPTMAFLSGVTIQAREVPDWVNLVVFVSEPFMVQTGPVLSPIIHDTRVRTLSPVTGSPGTSSNVSPPGPEITHLGRALVPGGPEEHVRYFLAYTRADVEGNPMPDWITSRGRSKGEPHRKRRSRPEHIFPIPRNLSEGDRVTISTHGDNQGTVLSADPLVVVVQMDGEPGPRVCLPENVKLTNGPHS